MVFTCYNFFLIKRLIFLHAQGSHTIASSRLQRASALKQPTSEQPSEVLTLMAKRNPPPNCKVVFQDGTPKHWERNTKRAIILAERALSESEEKHNFFVGSFHLLARDKWTKSVLEFQKFSQLLQHVTTTHFLKSFYSHLPQYSNRTWSAQAGFDAVPFSVYLLPMVASLEKENAQKSIKYLLASSLPLSSLGPLKQS